VIVDSSAVVAILADEPDADVYRAALLKTDVTALSAATYVECGIVLDRHRSTVGRGLDTLLREVGTVIEPFTHAQARIAREAYRDFGRGSGHPARLNLGDCFSYALAIERNEPLLFQGDDFAHTDVRSALDPRER
jgi:ribonuclease VapC